MIIPSPIVLVRIDENSRLHILRHTGVMIALLDERVDPHVVILPDAHQPLEINDAIRSYPIVSWGRDDAAGTAGAAISMLERGRVVVAAVEETT